MTNEKKIQEMLNEPCWDSKPYLIGMDKIGVEDVMERFADWKDEQFSIERKQLIEKANQAVTQAFENGAIFKKQQVLEKAINLMQHWILEHDYVDIFELEDYIKQQMEDDK